MARSGLRRGVLGDPGVHGDRGGGAGVDGTDRAELGDVDHVIGQFERFFGQVSMGTAPGMMSSAMTRAACSSAIFASKASSWAMVSPVFGAVPEVPSVAAAEPRIWKAMAAACDWVAAISPAMRSFQHSTSSVMDGWFSTCWYSSVMSAPLRFHLCGRRCARGALGTRWRCAPWSRC